MAKIGSAAWALLAVTCAASTPALAADPDFYMTADRTEVGTEDTFTVTLVLANAPQGGQLKLPIADGFEILGRSTSSQTSFQMGSGGNQINQITKTILQMRATRTGALTLPPAEYTAGGKTWKTDPLKITAKAGQLAPPRAAPRPRDPLDDLFGRLPRMEDPVRIPTSNSDLFVRAQLDEPEVFVGEQVTYSLQIFSRVTVLGIDAPALPKFEGFLSEDLDAPNQITPTEQNIEGVPYRVYLVRRRALFPTREGELQIGAAEMPVTVAGFFPGDKVLRKSNVLKLKVKPLPGGAPPGFSKENVGQWRLSATATETKLELGQPLTIRVVLEGKGNVKLVNPPPLVAPPGLKVYEPAVTVKTEARGHELGGRKVVEYLVMPQQTGTFEFEPLRFAYFDPEKKAYAETAAAPLRLEVVPAASGQTRLPRTPDEATAQDPNGARNVLSAGSLRTLRISPTFSAPHAPVWEKPYFWPGLVAPFGLFLSAVAVGFVRSRLGASDPETLRRRRGKEAQSRLAAAKKLLAAPPREFYGELERALLQFLDAKLGVAAGGLTHEALGAKMAELSVPEDRRAAVLKALELTHQGRYAPGGGGASRQEALDQIASVMSGWEGK